MHRDRGQQAAQASTAAAAPGVRIMNSPYIGGAVIDGPVGLIVSEARGRRNAMAVSWFSEAAHHPASLWVSIARTAYTHELIEAGGAFSLIVLHRKQKGIARRCGEVSGREADKCAGLALYRSHEGFLFLAEALASVACRVRSSRSLGDHTLFVADIVGGEVETRRAGRRHLLTTDLSS